MGDRASHQSRLCALLAPVHLHICSAGTPPVRADPREHSTTEVGQVLGNKSRLGTISTLTARHRTPGGRFSETDWWSVPQEPVTRNAGVSSLGQSRDQQRSEASRDVRGLGFVCHPACSSVALKR
jgi:hypothetical protein